jgi:hypothetical protein
LTLFPQPDTSWGKKKNIGKQTDGRCKMSRAEKIWIIAPNWGTQPETGYFASRTAKKMPENAIKIIHDHHGVLGRTYRWLMYINGRATNRCRTWEELAMAYGDGLLGRRLTAEQYVRLMEERLKDEQDGGVVQLDPMKHPAPQF